MKTEQDNNIAQFQINSRFTLSLSDWFTSGNGYEAALIDNKPNENALSIIELNNNMRVLSIEDLQLVIDEATEKANIIENLKM